MNKPAIILLLCKIALFVLVFMSVISHVVADSAPKKMQIGVKKRPSECPMKSKKGDLLHMHYTVISLLIWSVGRLRGFYATLIVLITLNTN